MATAQKMGSVDESEDSYALDHEDEEVLTPETCHNTMLLAELSHDVIQQLLLLRHRAGIQYTNVGNNVLLSLSSNQDAPSPAVQSEFEQRQLFESRAHPFALAEHVTCNMRRMALNQAVVFMGNSPAGKSQAFRDFMRYLTNHANPFKKSYSATVLEALRTTHEALHLFSTTYGEEGQIENSITNSELIFDVTGSPIGARINSVLIGSWKSHRRTVSSESNFAIFYFLLERAPDSLVAQLGLTREPADYAILATYDSLPAMHYAMEFPELVMKLRDLGLREREVDHMWSVLAAIIHLGQITFEHDLQSKAKVAPGSNIDKIAGLLLMEPAELYRFLLYRELSVGAEYTEVHLTVAEAEGELKRVVRGMAESLFYWLVHKANCVLRVTSGPLHYGRLCSLSILNAPAFKDEGRNSLGELLTNYISESLHHSYLQGSIRRHQELYAKDGLPWTPVRFQSNRMVLELVGQPFKGMISILDEGNIAAGFVTDRMFYQAIKAKLTDNKHFLHHSPPNIDHCYFTLNHIWKPVSYYVDGFLEQNDMKSHVELKELILTTSQNFVSRESLGGDSRLENSIIVDYFRSLTQKEPSGRSGGGRQIQLPETETLGSRVKSLVGDLMKSLEKRETYFVYCLDADAPMSELGPTLEKMCLLEVTLKSQSGFVLSLPYSRFLARYKMLTQYTWPNFRGKGDVQAIKVLLHMLGVMESCAFGHQMLHVHSQEALAQLELMRASLLTAVIKFMQKMWRGAIARKRFRVFYAMFKIVRKFRAWKFKTYLISLVKKFGSVHEQPDLGKSIEWPLPPCSLEKFHLKLHNTFRRWRLRQRLKSVPEDEWPEIRIKIAAMEILAKQRPDLGVNRRWKANYLGLTSEHDQAATYLSSVSEILAEDNSTDIVFSSFARKVSPRRGKASSRAFLWTDKCLYKLDQKNDFKLLKSWDLSEVCGVSVTRGADQLLALHTRGARDIVMCLVDARLENRVPELVAGLCVAYRRNAAAAGGGQAAAELKVTVVDDLVVRCSIKQVPHSIVVVGSSESKPQFRKEHGVKQWTLYWPNLA